MRHVLFTCMDLWGLDGMWFANRINGNVRVIKLVQNNTACCGSTRPTFGSFYLPILNKPLPAPSLPPSPSGSPSHPSSPDFGSRPQASHPPRSRQLYRIHLLVFHIDDAVLRTGIAAITINIYAARSCFLFTFDTLIGTAHALLSTLRSSTVNRFVTVQVRRSQSLFPQGILNLDVSLLDAYVRSLPIFAELADAGASSAIVCNNAPMNKNKQAPIDRDEAAAVPSKELPPSPPGREGAAVADIE